MSKRNRILVTLGLFVVPLFLAIWVAMSYVGTEPAHVTFIAGHKPGQPVHVVAQTDGAVGTGAHPTWVSYQVLDPHTHHWVHTTLWQLPPATRIDMTIYQFDSGSPLRNQQWGRVTGTIGGVATLDGKQFRVLNSYVTGVGHTFAVPALGINVPLRGNKTTEKGFCTMGPCSPTKNLHHTIKFAFETPKYTGNYRFQCFIPCGAGRYAGNGTAMETEGYMMGFLQVMR